jgi:hypothetical protein
MRVIYTSKGMLKRLGCALYIRCALSIEKYDNSSLLINIAIFMLEYYPINCRLFKLQQTRQVDVAVLLHIIIREIFLPEPLRRHCIAWLISPVVHYRKMLGNHFIYTKTISFKFISRLSCTIQINADITIRSKILSLNDPYK